MLECLHLEQALLKEVHYIVDTAAIGDLMIAQFITRE